MQTSSDCPLTVLMTVYNGGGFLRVALESILRQTYRNFRFLVVDDASTDDSVACIRSYEDARIELLPLQRNVGQTAALNLGLRHATTSWIARMDADDFSAPTRLEEQMDSLKQHPHIRCLGTGIWEFREDPAVVDRTLFRPQQPDQVRRATLHGSGMVHGSIVVDRDLLLACGAYDERYRYASDRDLFFRLLARCQAMNLPRALLGIRRHPHQDSFSKIAADEYVEVFQRQLTGNGYSPDELSILRRSLAYSYLFRSQCGRREGDPLQWLWDQIRAFQTSPRTWARGALGSLNRFLPKEVQASSKEEFWN